MLERMRMVSLACAAVASAGCPSLDALECHGAGCADGASTAEAAGGEAAPSATGIFCGGGTPCTPRAQECCLDPSGATSCASTFTCGNIDIYCDDPSQCIGAGTCWICENVQGFQGTSCDYQDCDAGNALALCHSSSQCEGGTTCKPFPVQGLDPGDGGSWFQACQP